MLRCLFCERAIVQISIQYCTCFNALLSPYLISSLASLPAITLSTMLFAIISTLSASLPAACCRTASASSRRPRWISETACEMSDCEEDVDAACANSSKT